MQKVVTYVLNPIMLVIFAAGLFLFMFGAVQLLYKMSQASQTNKDLTDGRKHMLYGILGMLIMVSIAGIINFLASSLGIDISGNPDTTRLDTTTINTSFR